MLNARKRLVLNTIDRIGTQVFRAAAAVKDERNLQYKREANSKN